MFGSVSHLLSFVCCTCSTLFFRLNIYPPSAAVGVDTFHPGYLTSPRLTPRHADGPWEVFGMTSPLC